MKITQEMATVFADAEKRELSVLMAGVRITLNADEARALASVLSVGLKQLNLDHSWTRPVLAETPKVDKADDEEKTVADFRALVEGKPKGELAEAAGLRRPTLG